MRSIHFASLLASTLFGLSSLASAKSQMHLSFDGPYLKSFPAQDGGQVVVNNQPASVTVRLTCDWEAGALGNYFVFDGSSDPDNMNNTWAATANHVAADVKTNDFSISIWVRTTSNRLINTILDKRKAGTGFHVALYNGLPLIQMTTATLGATNWYAPVAINDGQWHKLDFYVTRDRTDGGKIYSDGTLVHTFNPIAYKGQSLSNDESLWIGRHTISPENNFEGALDDLWIFQK